MKPPQQQVLTKEVWAEMAPAERAKVCHAIYVNYAKYDVAFNIGRERDWADWLVNGWTPWDLILVIQFIRSKIGHGRYQGALKFSNLIRDPDKFEEDLSDARKAKGQKQPSAKDNLLGDWKLATATATNYQQDAAGRLQPVESQPAKQASELANELLNPEQRAELARQIRELRQRVSP